MLSRNFRLQKVGDINWLQKNYDFSKISFYIDELIILDITGSKRNPELFCETLKKLTKGCFVPICAGGGVRTVEYARKLLRSGADKISINTSLFTQPKFVHELASEFGQQCVVASVDIKEKNLNGYEIKIESGSQQVKGNLIDLFKIIDNGEVGELYLNSIDRDGTGQGYLFPILDFLPPEFTIPVIMAGGAGNAQHFEDGLNDRRIDAVATAHLFNFIGDGLQQARNNLIFKGVELAKWPSVEVFHKNI